MATPPPLPSAPLPPMKVEPINMTIPQSSNIRKRPSKSPLNSTAVTPTRLPRSKYSYSAASTTAPVASGSLSSEEEIIPGDATRKTRRLKPGSRRSLRKSSESTSISPWEQQPASANTSPRIRAKHTSSSNSHTTTTNDTTLAVSPKVRPQTTHSGGLAPPPPMPKTRDATTGGLARSSSLHAVTTSTATATATRRKNSTTSTELDGSFDKGSLYTIYIDLQDTDCTT